MLVCTAGGANAISVAELTIFYMLYCSRNFKKVQSLYLEDYRQAKMGVPKTELEGKTLGLVGLGNIGKLVAKKAALGFDMTVLAYDPFAKKEGLPDYISWWRTGTRSLPKATTSPSMCPPPPRPSTPSVTVSSA